MQMYNIIYKGKIIARVARKSGVGVTFHFPFDTENGYQVYKIVGDNYYVKLEGGE